MISQASTVLVAVPRTLRARKQRNTTLSAKVEGSAKPRIVISIPHDSACQSQTATSATSIIQILGKPQFDGKCQLPRRPVYYCTTLSANSSIAASSSRNVKNLSALPFFCCLQVVPSARHAVLSIRRDREMA